MREKRCGCLCILKMPIHACNLCLIMNDAYNVNYDEKIIYKNSRVWHMVARAFP